MKGFTFSINMSCNLKCSLILPLICGLCYGENIHRCFTENKNTVQVDVHCQPGHIHLHEIAFSI